MLAAAQAAPQDTLRVIFHARDCRKGKGIRTQALHSLGTFMLACSQRQHVLCLLVGMLPDYGRFRDLLDLVKQLERRDRALSPSCREAVLCAYLGQLQADLAVLQANNRASISLAAKWLTSEKKRGLAKVSISIACMLCASVLAHQHGCAFAFWLAIPQAWFLLKHSVTKPYFACCISYLQLPPLRSSLGVCTSHWPALLLQLWSSSSSPQEQP